MAAAFSNPDWAGFILPSGPRDLTGRDQSNHWGWFFFRPRAATSTSSGRMACPQRSDCEGRFGSPFSAQPTRSTHKPVHRAYCWFYAPEKRARTALRVHVERHAIGITYAQGVAPWDVAATDRLEEPARGAGQGPWRSRCQQW
jgi:hypothetical protein